MTARQNRPRTVRYAVLLVALVFVGLSIPVILEVRASTHYRERAAYAKQQVEGLKSSCPGNVPVQQWERGVDWTSNAISQIYFSPTHGDIESLENLCQFLDHQIQTDVGLNTLRSIWEEYEKARGRGQKYATTFRDVRLLTEEPITDDDLTNLWSLDRCLYLDLSNTAVTDAGMKHLSEAKFELLDLSGTKVGDQGIKELMLIKSLTGLHIGNTLVTNDGLNHLLSKPTIDSLSLTNTVITDEGLKYVEQLTRLETLWLDGTKITDRGLMHLTNLHEMTQLDLTATSVTSDGVLQLKDLKSLRMVILKNTAISKDQIVALETAFQNCKFRD